jgi:hypothetical protein
MRKLLSLSLAFCVICASAFGANAAIANAAIARGEIAGIAAAGFADALGEVVKSGGVTHSGKTVTDLAQLSNLKARPGDVVSIKLAASMFLKEDGNPLGPVTDAVSYDSLEDAGMSVRQVTSRGEGIAAATLDESKDGAFIKLEFAQGLAYLNQSFSFSVYLGRNGARETATRINIKGRVSTDVFEAYAGKNYEDISGGDGIKAMANIANFEFYLGRGVSVTRNITRGITYYGVASNDLAPTDEALYLKYRDLADIYRLQTVNLKTAGNTVRFDLGETYHIYNTRGEYLGTSDQALPYWTTYYICFERYPSLDVS